MALPPHATPRAALEVFAIQADLQQSPFLVLTQGVQHIPAYASHLKRSRITWYRYMRSSSK
jgi:hypothetical protein